MNPIVEINVKCHHWRPRVKSHHDESPQFYDEYHR